MSPVTQCITKDGNSSYNEKGKKVTRRKGMSGLKNKFPQCFVKSIFLLSNLTTPRHESLVGNLVFFVFIKNSIKTMVVFVWKF